MTQVETPLLSFIFVHFLLFSFFSSSFIFSSSLSFSFSSFSYSYQDYWNKRNARVQIPKKPAPQLTDEQLAKRAEKLARSREEHRLREDAAHERIARKQEEARVGKEVFKGIFLGGKHAAKNWEFFEKSQIRAVINVTSEVPNYHEKNGAVKYIKYACRLPLSLLSPSLSLIFLFLRFNFRVHVSDLPTVDLLETFEKLSDSIYELTQQGNVLIHCKEGTLSSPPLLPMILPLPPSAHFFSRQKQVTLDLYGVCNEVSENESCRSARVHHKEVGDSGQPRLSAATHGVYSISIILSLDTLPRYSPSPSIFSLS